MKQIKKFTSVLLAAAIIAGLFPASQSFAEEEVPHEANLERTCSIYYQNDSVVKSINGITSDDVNNGYEQYNKNSTVDGKNWGGYAFSQFSLTDEQINSGISGAEFEAYISNTSAGCKVNSSETPFTDYNYLTYFNYLESFGYVSCSYTTGEQVTIDGTKYVKITADVSDYVKKFSEELSEDTSSASNITIAVTSCNSRAKMIAYGSEYQPKLTLTYNNGTETIPEKEGAVYSIITKALSDNPSVDTSKLSNSPNITGYQITVANDNKEVSQRIVERGNNINGLDSIDVTASEGDDIEIAPIYEYKKTRSYGDGIKLDDTFPNGRYNITVTNGSSNHTDLYVNGYMAANNIDQNGAGRSVSTGSTYTAHDIRVESEEQKITIQTKDSPNSLSYIKIVKSPSVVSRKKKIFITGDSLVANYYGGNEENYLGTTQTGWGQVLSNFINSDRYEVVNLANAGYWAATLKTTAYPGIIYNASEGDIFLLESGVNDYWNPDSKGAEEGLDSNRNTMKSAVIEMTEGAKAANLPIILVNPNAMPSRHNESNCFSDVILETAKEQNIPAIDLSSLSSKALHELYYDEDNNTFNNNIGNNFGVIKGKPSDYTHSSYLGAMKYASIVAEELYKLGWQDMINTEFSYSKKDGLGNNIICQVSTESTPSIAPTFSPVPSDTAAPTSSPVPSDTAAPTQTPDEKQCIKVIAEYDGHGALINVTTETINISDAVTAENTPNKKVFYWKSLESMEPIETSVSTPFPTKEPNLSNADYIFTFGSNNDIGNEINVGTETVYGKQVNGMTYGFYGLKGSPDVSDGRTDGFKYSDGEPYTVLKTGSINGSTYVEADYSSYDEDTLNNMAGGKMPIRFSAEAEEHKYYTVSATIVNTSSTENADVTLYSEKRHAILSGYKLKPNESITKTWNVNLESVAYLSEDNPRSDTQLNFAVVGDNAGLSKIEIKKNDTFGTTVWMADDSTGFDQTSFIPYYPLRNYGGVGSLLTKYLNPNIAISNQGESGLGVTRDEKHWNNIKAHANTGDYIFIQYGYNDHSTDTHVSGLEKYYDFAKENGMKLVIISQTDRRNTSVNWDGTNKKWTASMSGYAAADKKFVDDKISNGAKNIAYIDLNTPYVDWMNTVGDSVFEQRKKAGFDDTEISNMSMNYYYMASRTEGIDTVHINDYGADRAAYIIAQQVKSIVEKGSLENASENEKIQADTLRILYENMPSYSPSEVSDETVAKGWAINSEYPNVFPGNVSYKYPVMIKSAEIDNGILTNITVKIQQEGLPKYAIGCADILNPDETVRETVYTSSTSLNENMPHIDTSNTTYGQIITMNFDNISIPPDCSYRLYIKGIDNGQEPSLSDTMYSSYYTEPPKIIESLINEEFNYTQNSSIVNQGTPKWEFAGSASQKSYKTAIKDNEKCINISTDGSGTYSLCKQFSNYTKITDGKLKLHLQLNYLYGRFIIKLNQTAKTASYMNGLEALTVNDGEIILPNGTSAGNIKTGKWTDIDIILDIDRGTETIYIAGNDGISCNIPMLQTSNKTDAEKLLPITGISFTYVQNPSTIVAYPFDAYISELMLDKTENDTPQIKILAECDNGIIYGGGTYNINSDVTLSAAPANNYAFTGWYIGENLYSLDNPLIIERVRSDISLTAKFKEVDFDNDTSIKIKENSSNITQIRQSDICVLENTDEEQIKNELQSKYDLNLSYSINNDILTVTSQNGKTERTYKITYVKVWDLTKAVSEKMPVSEFNYNGLKIKGNETSDYLDTSVGMHFNGKTSSANRYISYIPEIDGIFEITAKCAYSKGSLQITTSDNCSGGYAIENLKDNSEWKSGTAPAIKNTVYYLYNATSGMEIKKIIFTPNE